MKWLIFIPWSPLHLLSLNYQYDSLYTAFPVCVMWTIFNVSTEFVMTLLLFYFFFWFFDHKVCRILVPQPGIELALPALEGEILTSGPLGKSLHCFLKFVPLTIFYPPFQMALPTLLCYSWVWKRMFTSIILKLVSTSFSPSQISVVRVPQPPINPSKQASLAPCPYVWPTLLTPSLTSLCGAYITQSCPTLCVPWTVARQAPLSMGILQARILGWAAMPSSRGSSQPRDQTQVSHIAGGFFTSWASREAHATSLLPTKDHPSSNFNWTLTSWTIIAHRRHCLF